MKRQLLIVTGTDTGIGKTVVTATLVAGLRARGVDAWPMKPVQTGVRGAASLDLAQVLLACALDTYPSTLDLLSPIRLTTPASVHLAARLERRRVSAASLAGSVRRALRVHPVLVVEGAGGILVPLNERETMLDLFQRLAAPAVVVARPGLGTLNHTMLTVDRLRAAGIAVRGVVLSQASARWGRIEDDNLATLAVRLSLPVARLPLLRALTPQVFAREGARLVDAFQLA